MPSAQHGDGPPLYGWFYLVEGLATFVGLILFRLATARAAVLPRSAGYLMAVAGVLGLPVFIFTVSQVVALVPQIFGFLAVAWMAVALFSENL